MSPDDLGFFERTFHDLTSGRGQLRLILQPLIATFLGARLGIADAKEGKDPFLLRMFKTSNSGATLFKESLSDVVLPLCIGIVLDGIIQYLTFGSVRLLQAVFVGLLLVWLPYSCSRAITNRIVRRRSAGERRAHG